LKIEITAFRAEGRYSDKRHPDQVKFIKNYKEDAKRRDFTINALYFDPITKELFDPTKQGLKDLKSRLLRFVGDPKKRIDEDALRMMRGVRLATQLDFKLEKNAFAAIKTRAKYIQDISGERIKAELDKILLSKNRVEGLKLLDETGLLRFIIPEFEKLKTISHKSKFFHLEGNIFKHTFLVINSLRTQNLDLLYAGLFHDTGKVITPVWVFKDSEWRNSFRGHDRASVEIFEKFSQKFKFSKESRNNTLWLIKNHDNWRDFANMKIAKQIEFITNKNFPLLVQLMQADEAGNIRLNPNDDHARKSREELYKTSSKLLKALEKTKNLQNKLARGDLIMKYSNIKPGRQLGQKIEEIKTKIILGKIKNEKDLKRYLN